ncbi:MAG: PRC-barrel domain-containing protein, partial [Pseudomonadota bacterium]
YLTANPIDADSLDHQPVVNLNGERVGMIEDIIRSTEDNQYYAMIDLEGHTLDRRPSYLETDTVGVPLNDVLLFEEGRSLVLTTRGDEYLRDAEAREIENWEEVDTLYSL